MPFGALNAVVEELTEKLRQAKAEEFAAVEELRAHMHSRDLDEATLTQLTADMVRTIEYAAAVWKELQDAMDRGRSMMKSASNRAD
jgi:hypothetical protein